MFGNGVLKDGRVIDEGFIDMEQIGIVIPGQTNDLNQSIDPLLGDDYSTLGETPNNTTLTITYRVGGGINSNVPSGDLTTLPTTITGRKLIVGEADLDTVINNTPAVGGKDEEDTLEIREKAKAFFSTQNRCVTKEDYEARVLNIPSKFGNIAKVYVTRGSNLTLENTFNSIEEQVSTIFQLMKTEIESIRDDVTTDNDAQTVVKLTSFLEDIEQLSNISYPDPSSLELFSTINIYVLAYNNRKQLVGNPHTESTDPNYNIKDNLPLTLTGNIKKYLENFKLMTDVVTINDGYIVNFGVMFDVIAEKYANKQKVKLDCIQRIKDYFNINKMQFNQPIYKSQLEYELMGVEGVRSIGHVTLTQHKDYFYEDGETLLSPTYRYSFSVSGTGADLDGDGIIDGGFIDQSDGEGTVGYGYKYDFQTALSDDGTIILPPNSATPTVFELKNPNTNIQGRVR